MIAIETLIPKMPERCADCPSIGIYNKRYYCTLRGRIDVRGLLHGIVNPDTRAGICPLIEIPDTRQEIIRCNECEYGELDEDGEWFCRSVGCQIGSEDGSGYCADGERKHHDKS